MNAPSNQDKSTQEKSAKDESAKERSVQETKPSKAPSKPEDTNRQGDAKSGVGEDNQQGKGQESPHDYIVQGGKNGDKKP